MARVPYDIAWFFVHGKKVWPNNSRSNNLRTDGQSIYSYGMLLAHKTDASGKSGFIEVDYRCGIDRRSVTTSRHQRALESVLSMQTQYPVIYKE